MRRKSERNKAKASPEKKVEKPTRKSTRRRAKKSPSTSPERDNSNDIEAAQINKSETAYKTRLHSKEVESLVEEPETKVSSTETVPTEASEDSGSVWKAARADASPGEIPKLKLCRQRNLSETSDVSLNRKRTGKWQESGEGVAEEADSADERPASSGKLTDVGDEPAGDPSSSSSTLPGRSSLGEEVSDSKEIPPEKASADLSDDKKNIDRQDDTIATSNHPTHTRNIDDADDVDEAAVGTTQVVKTEDALNGIQETKEILPDENPSLVSPEKMPAEESLAKVALVNSKVAPMDDKVVDVSGQTKSSSEAKLSVEKSTDDRESEQCKQPKEVQKDVNRSEDEKEEIKKCVETLSGSSDNSNDEAQRQTAKINVSSRVPTRNSRRKHRDKYRDSSNSDSGDSDDEPRRRIGEITKEVRIESKSTREQSPVITVEAEKISSAVDNSKPLDQVEKMAEDENIIESSDKQKISTLNDKKELVKSGEQTQISKPAKVNLKRSFHARISVDTAENKKDGADENDNSQDKENHTIGDHVEANIMPKRRRWGTARISDTVPAFSISTDSLKALVPGAKTLSISEVRLSKDDDDDRDRRREREKRYSATDGPVEKPKDDSDPLKNDNHIVSRRKISIVKDTPHLKSPSPSQTQLSSILLIKNLVRPFTLNQFKELLSRTGTIVENGFWMDRIKSKCYVEYSNEDQAFETRQALHGIPWPLSNSKKLQVEYATKEDMDQARELSKDQLNTRKTEAIATTDMWQQEWIRDDKSNSTTKVTVVREWDLGKEDGQHLLKEKEREKKDLEKKRRQKSRSPTSDPHLPAPARKFKKKEDEPPPAKLLDDLFRKTKASPCIYWLPLTNEQIVVKEEMRRQHMAEHARRLEEMRRTERNRDGRRRRSPRK